MKETFIKRPWLASTLEVSAYVECLEQKLIEAHSLVNRSLSITYDNENRFYQDVERFSSDELFIVIDNNK